MRRYLPLLAVLTAGVPTLLGQSAVSPPISLPQTSSARVPTEQVMPPSSHDRSFAVGREQFRLVLRNRSANSSEPIRIEFLSSSGTLLSAQELTVMNPAEERVISGDDAPTDAAVLTVHANDVVDSHVESTSKLPTLRGFDGRSHVVVPGLFDRSVMDRRLNLWNSSWASAIVSVAVIDRDGSSVATATLAIPARQSVSTMIGSLFDQPLPSAFVIRLTSDVALIGEDESAPEPKSGLGARTLAALSTTPAPTDLENRIRQSLSSMISIDLAPPQDWGRLLSLQWGGELNHYFVLYNSAVEARGAAALQAIAALKAVKIGKTEAAQTIYSNALVIWNESNTMFSAAAQLNVDSVDHLDATLMAVRERSFKTAGILCAGLSLAKEVREMCGYAIDALDAGTEYAVTSSMSGQTEAQRQLAATVVVKALLDIKVDGFSISDFIKTNVNNVTGTAAAPYFQHIAKIAGGPDTAKVVLKLLASYNVSTVTKPVEDTLKQLSLFYTDQVASAPVTAPKPPPSNVWLQLPQLIYTVQQGQTVRSTVVTQRKGFDGAFPLYASAIAGLGDPLRSAPPVGLSISFGPTAPTANDSPAMFITAATNLAPGSYRIFVSGLGVNVTSHGFYATVNVVAKPDVTSSIDSSVKSVRQGETAVYTLSLRSINGFVGTVSTSLLSPPPGVTTVLNSSNTSLTANGQSTVTLRMATTTVTPVGTLSGTIRLSGPGLTTRDIPVSLVVSRPPDFTVGVDVSSRSITQTQAATFTVTVRPSDGFNGQVFLAAIGVPVGTTSAGWTASSLNAQGSTTLTINTGTTTGIGTFVVTLRASSSGYSTKEIPVTISISQVAPSVRSFSYLPSPAKVSRTVTLAITGSNFTSISEVWLVGPGCTGQGCRTTAVTVNSPTQIGAQAILNNIGSYVVNLRNGAGSFVQAGTINVVR